jgi:hypothetical protein
MKRLLQNNKEINCGIIYVCKKYTDRMPYGSRKKSKNGPIDSLHTATALDWPVRFYLAAARLRGRLISFASVRVPAYLRRGEGMQHMHWRSDFVSARRFLVAGRLAEALRRIESAISACPIEERSALSRMLYFAGIILFKLGNMSAALKSWAPSMKLTKNGASAKMYRRFTNGYGMQRNPDAETDDFLAFRSVQVGKFLKMKENGRFTSDVERDMALVLIADAFVRLKKTYPLTSLSCQEKIALFRRAGISFPLAARLKYENEIIHADFIRNRVMDDGARCLCGSGLSYLTCCGRIPACSDVENGTF